MKRKFLFLAMTLFLATSVQANVNDDDDVDDITDTRSSVVKLGPKLGINMATMSKYKGADLGQGMGIGFQGGLAIQAHLGRKRGADAGTGPMAVQLELLYARNSIKTSSENINLSYFEVPVLAKFFPLPILSIELGPTFCKLLSSSPEMISERSQQVRVKTGDFKGGDIKLTVGVNLETKVGFVIGARYNMGTSKLAGNFPCRVSDFSINAIYLFDIFKF